MSSNNQVSEETKKTIIITKEKGYLKVVLNNPKTKNSLSSDGMKYFLDSLKQAEFDDSIFCVYLTGTGDFFTSGNDFNAFAKYSFDEMAGNFENFINYLIDYPKILIAGVNGLNYGVGFTMLMNFDIVLCSSKANFVVPFIQTLQAPEGTSSYTFPRMFGKVAGHLLYKGDPIDAVEAKNLGLVSKIFDHEVFHKSAIEYVEAVCKHGLDSLVKFKSMVTRYNKEELKQVNKFEASQLRKSWENPEFKKIIAKFTKQPKF